MGPSSSNLGAWTSKTSTSAAEWHRITQITVFQKKQKKTKPTDPRVTSTPSPGWFRPLRGGQSEPKVLQKASSGLHFCFFFCAFWATWAHELSRLLPMSNCSPKRPSGLPKKNKYAYFYCDSILHASATREAQHSKAREMQRRGLTEYGSCVYACM